jgi:hypothetical protein
LNSRQKLIQQQFLNNEGQVLKRLKSIYTASLNDVNDKISTLEFDIDRLQFEYDWAEDGAEKSKLQSQIQSKIYQKRYQKALQEQLDGILQKMNDKAFTTVSEYLNECYDEGFIGTMYDLHGQGIPLIMPINQEAMVRAVQLDSKISTTLYKKMGENVTKLKRDIAAKVSRGIASGMSYSQVAQQIRFKMIGTYNTNGGAFGRALTIARTEGHRIQVQAGMDACNAAKDMGADVLKQWDSALDARTRPSHRIVDGEIRELDKPFSNGLQYPGDSSGGAAEVVNCRCALLQRAKWALDEEELETLKKRAEYYGLDKTENFEDFKQKYLSITVYTMGESFATDLMNTKLSPMAGMYATYDDYAKAKAEFDGERTDYLADVLNKSEGYELNVYWGSYSGSADTIPQIEHTMAELQKRYPIPNSLTRNDQLTYNRINVCDYESAHLFLPDGADDKRISEGAIAQVFKTDNELTIAYGRNYMYQTMEECLAERAKAVASGEILMSVNGGSPQTVVMHEWGHIMSAHFSNAMMYDDETVLEYWEWYKSLDDKDIAHGISEYATKNRGEFEAECFAELQMPNPRPLAVKFGEYLDKIIAKGY